MEKQENLRLLKQEIDTQSKKLITDTNKCKEIGKTIRIKTLQKETLETIVMII